jgi:hypothetical protein
MMAFWGSKAPMKPVSVIVFAFLAIAGVYVAGSGWVRVEVRTALKQGTIKAPIPVEYEGITFASEEDRNRFIAWNEGKKFVPWAFKLPYPVALLITVMSFGFLGGVIKVLFQLAHGDREPVRPWITLPLSAMTGLLVLAVSYSLPAAITTSDATVRPVVLLFFCLLGGLFSRHLLLWLSDQFEKVFERKSKDEQK